MRLGIISDTHGDMTAMRQVVALTPPVDCWLHAGDHARDGAFLEKLTATPVYSVCGNTDLFLDCKKIDEFITMAGKKIWLTHGHTYHVHGNDVHELLYWGRQYDADIIIFGHTHESYVDCVDGKLVINPGSASRPRGGSAASFAVLTLSDEGETSVQICRLDQKECFSYKL